MSKPCHCCRGSGVEEDDAITGLKMKRQRVAVAITQSDMARHCRISKGYLSQLEHGTRHWSTELLFLFTEAVKRAA